MGSNALDSHDACQQAQGAVDKATGHANSLPSPCGMGSDALNSDDACQQAKGAVVEATGRADSLPSRCGQLSGKTPQSLHSPKQQPVVLAAVQVHFIFDSSLTAPSFRSVHWLSYNCSSIDKVRTSLPGELRLAPHAPGPGCHTLCLSFVFFHLITVTVIIDNCATGSRHACMRWLCR